MYTEGMTEREKIDRNVCLTLAVSIRRMLTENNQNFQDYIQYYNYTRRQLKELNDYAQKRYQDIQGSLLRNTNENYFSILNTTSCAWWWPTRTNMCRIIR